MNNYFRNIMIIFLVLCFTACEKRMELDIEIPLDEARVFCEIMGFINVGFVGTVSLIKPVQTPTSGAIKTHISIWEEDVLIFDTEIGERVYLSYNINPAKVYKMELRYKDILVKSHTSVSNLPRMFMRNFQAKNQYIDSLKINVVSTSFDFEALETMDSIYYVAGFKLSDMTNSFFDIGEITKPKTISQFKSTFVQHLIANKENQKLFRASLLVIDQYFYQYLKNIIQLGQIPNDNIQGHHGNIENGIGYFGIANYDSRLAYF